MLLSTLILVLQEIFEALLLISILLVLTRSQPEHPVLIHLVRYWLPLSLLVGAVGAWLFAVNVSTIARAFNYMGLEISNAILDAYTVLWLLLFHYLAPLRLGARPLLSNRTFMVLAIVHIVAMGIIREGAEIVLYLQGVLIQPESVQAVLTGTVLAVIIAASLAILLFVALANLPGAWPLRISLLLLALFGGNMASQCISQLVQADWLPESAPLWDSAYLLPEYSLPGQLLYALIGYDANPTILQVAAYAGVLLLVLASPLFRMAWRSDCLQADRRMMALSGK